MTANTERRVGIKLEPNIQDLKFHLNDWAKKAGIYCNSY